MASGSVSISSSTILYTFILVLCDLLMPRIKPESSYTHSPLFPITLTNRYDMACYLIGDLQGCCQPFLDLLDRISFSPSRDHLILLGDMVNRGPQSLQTLNIIMQLDNAVTCLLGNHDMHLIGVAYGARQQSRHDTLSEILNSPNRWRYIDWLRQQHLALYQHGWLMVHAGVVPQWDIEQTLACALEVEEALRSPDIGRLINELFGNTPDQWSNSLKGSKRLRFILNTLTRTRFCSASGRLDFKLRNITKSPTPDLMPWFEVPGRRTADTPIAFGHWSVMGLVQRPNLLGLDTGCLWGGQLTAACIDDSKSATIPDAESTPILQVTCPLALDPYGVE